MTWAKQVQPGAARHGDIHRDQVHVEPLEPIDGGGGGSRPRRSDSRPELSHRADQAAHGGLVVDDHDGCGGGGRDGSTWIVGHGRVCTNRRLCENYVTERPLVDPFADGKRGQCLSARRRVPGLAGSRAVPARRDRLLFPVRTLCSACGESAARTAPAGWNGLFAQDRYNERFSSPIRSTLMRRILVTSALPYANGPIHLGHLVEYLQTDIWVRFQKLRGNRCVYVCADDTHGTAIMIRARQEGIREEELIARMQQAHLADFRRLPDRVRQLRQHPQPGEPRATARRSGRPCAAPGWSAEQEVTQLYDPVAGTFLADRFVKGTCPKCKAPDQYGDSCEKCGAHYSPTDLIDPVSTLSGAKPEIRTARHLFVNIERLHGFLDEWVAERRRLQPEMANYLKGHFLGEPLRDWDVSRPAPYFGFEIPDSPGNYWYVWFDAPIGYLASTRQWCDAARRDVRRLVAEPRDRGPPLHRQGHHLLPHALLAGDAQDGRLQPAARRSTSTASSPSTARRCRSRRGRSSRRRPTWSTSTRPTCATTTPRSSPPAWRTST